MAGTDTSKSAGARRMSAVGRGGALLGLGALVVAGALPAIALTIAERSATDKVRQTTFVGATATASAVANAASREYDAAVELVVRSRSAAPVLAAIRSTNDPAIEGLMREFSALGPYDGVAIYNMQAALVAGVAGASGVVPPPGPSPPSTVEQSPAESRGKHTIRRVRAPIVQPGDGTPLGTLIADIDLSRLITDTDSLRFGKTGVTKIVGTDGRVVLSPDGETGRPLLAAANQRIARAHLPATTVTFTPFYKRRSVESYVPSPGQPFGVLTQQSEAEAFAGVRRLGKTLRDLRAAFALVGVALGAAITTALHRRDRRLAFKTEQLDATYALFRSAFDDAPTGATLVSPEGRFLEVNQAFCDLTGYTRDELFGFSVTDITHPDDQAETRHVVSTLAAGDISSIDWEKRYVRHDGSVIWVQIRGSAVRDHDGRVIRTISHIVDITARRRAAEALRTALERERRAGEELRRLDSFRTDLLLTVSHDFRGPLFAIRGFVAALVDDWDQLDDAARRASVAGVERNADELERRVADFLEFSRLDDISVHLDVTSCNVFAATQAALERTSRYLADHRVRVDIAPGTAVWADEEALGRVLENLISNAGKYSPPGTEIGIAATAGGSDEVVISVDDDGPGIPPEQVERIFHRYYRAADGGVDAPDGTGIGLTGVRQLVGLMDGRVWVEPRPTGGSSFRVALRGGPPTWLTATGAAPEIGEAQQP